MPVSTLPFSERVSKALAVLTGRYRETPRPSMTEWAYADPYQFWGGQTRFLPYNPSKLVSAKGLEIFDEMRRDDQCKAALLFKKQSVLSAGWEVSPSDGEKASDEVSDFVTEVFDALEGTFENSLLEVMSSLDYGFSVSEKIWGEKEGKIWLTALKTRKPHPFRFEMDPYGNLLKLVQNGNNRDLDPDKFLIHTYQGEFGNPYGVSDLDAAYRAWWTKNNTYKWLAMLLEKYGIPPMIAMYNPDSFKGGQLDKLKQVLEGMQASTVAVVPRAVKEDLDFYSPQLAGQVSQCFVPAIGMLNQDIARAILMPGDLGYTPSEGGGSYAKAKVVFNIFLFAIEYLANDIANAVNEGLVKPLVDLNYAGKDYPVFRFKPMTDDQQFAKLEQWEKFFKDGTVKGQPEDEDHIRETLDFPVRQKKLSEEDYVPTPAASPFGGGTDRPSQAGKLPSESVSDNRTEARNRGVPRKTRS